MPNRKPVTKHDNIAAQADTAAVAADTGGNTPPAADGATPALTLVSAALTAHSGQTTAELAMAAKVGQSTAARILASLERRGAVRRIKGGRQGARLLPDRWEPVVATEPDGSEAATMVADLPEQEPEVGAKPTSPVLTDAETEPAPRAPSPQEAEPADSTETAEAQTAAEPEFSGGPDASVGTDASTEASAPRARGRKPRAEKVDVEKASGEGNTRLRPGKLREMVIEHMREHAQEEFSPSALGKVLDRSSGAIANCLETLQSSGIVIRTSEKPRRYRYLGTGRKAG